MEGMWTACVHASTTYLSRQFYINSNFMCKSMNSERSKVEQHSLNIVDNKQFHFQRRWEKLNWEWLDMSFCAPVLSLILCPPPPPHPSITQSCKKIQFIISKQHCYYHDYVTRMADSCPVYEIRFQEMEISLHPETIYRGLISQPRSVEKTVTDSRWGKF